MSIGPPGGAGLSGGPTVLRILLGAQLRRLRDAAGISREDAGYHIRASGSKISRMELGRVSFKERDVTDLLELYGVTDPSEREKLVQLTHEANAPAWWQKYQDVVPDWFAVYVGLEEAAQLIRYYEVQFVPGLLQTEEYARALISRSGNVIRGGSRGQHGCFVSVSTMDGQYLDVQYGESTGSADTIEVACEKGAHGRGDGHADTARPAVTVTTCRSPIANAG